MTSMKDIYWENKNIYDKICLIYFEEENENYEIKYLLYSGRWNWT